MYAGRHARIHVLYNGRASGSSLMESTFGGVLALLTEDAWSRLADLEETDGACLIEVDVPGAKRDSSRSR